MTSGMAYATQKTNMMYSFVKMEPRLQVLLSFFLPNILVTGNIVQIIAKIHPRAMEISSFGEDIILW